MRLSSSLLLSCLTVAALHPASARADAATETRLREALRATTAQLRTLEDERAKWQANEGLQKEVESLRKDLAAAKQSQAKGGAGLNRKLAEQAEANVKLAESLKQCLATSQEATTALTAKEEERARLAAESTSLSQRLSASEIRNLRMYKVGKSIIDWLNNLGVAAAIGAREPFLGIKRVELENIAQDYEDKLLEQRAQVQQP